MEQVTISSPSRKDQVIAQIEALVHAILEDLDNERTLVIPLRTTESSQTQNAQPNLNNYCFPDNTHSSEWRFTYMPTAIILRILDIIHEALIDDKVVSKRDVYYQDPDLFRSQVMVNKHLDNIALTFNVSVRDLNVTAEVKGLIAGPILVGKEEDGNAKVYINPKGILVPTSDEFPDLRVSSGNYPRFLLLVEKKATFRTLAHSSFHIRHKCVLLTGQGYPDLATRAFLHYFNNRLATKVPCYALVDFDPDGLCIYSVYTRGSQALSHEINIIVPTLRLLGLRAEDAMHLLGVDMATVNSQASKGSTAVDTAHPGNTMKLQFLSQRERQRAKGLLKRLTAEIRSIETDEATQEYMRQRWSWQEAEPQVCNKKQTEALIREMQVCLMMGYKVETQILDNRAGGLERWVLEKIEQQADRA